MFKKYILHASPTSAFIIRTSSIGEYNQFKRLTSTLTADDVLSYFIAKALLASLIGNHLMLSVFILDQGYPIQIDRGLPNILHECLQVCLDYQCASIVSLLHSKGLDINKQVRCVELHRELAPLDDTTPSVRPKDHTSPRYT
jgi:hypothetical protein